MCAALCFLYPFCQYGNWSFCVWPWLVRLLTMLIEKFSRRNSPCVCVFFTICRTDATHLPKITHLCSARLLHLCASEWHTFACAVKSSIATEMCKLLSNFFWLAKMCTTKKKTNDVGINSNRCRCAWQYWWKLCSSRHVLHWYIR